jgi:hypothetical protein
MKLARTTTSSLGAEVAADNADVGATGDGQASDASQYVISSGLTATAGSRSAIEPRLPLGARPARNAVIAAGLLGYAWFLGGAAPFSMKALLGVLLPGAVLGAIAYGRPPERIPPPQSIDVAGFSYWIISLALLFEWEASAVRDNSPPWHPSLTDLINPLIGPHAVKSAAVMIWLLAGWALVKR